MELPLKKKVCLPLSQECKSGPYCLGSRPRSSIYCVQLQICSLLSVCVGLSICKLQLLNSTFLTGYWEREVGAYAQSPQKYVWPRVSAVYCQLQPCILQVLILTFKKEFFYSRSIYSALSICLVFCYAFPYLFCLLQLNSHHCTVLKSLLFLFSGV